MQGEQREQLQEKLWTQELLQVKLWTQEPQLQEEQGEIWEIRWMTATRSVKTS